MILFEYMSRTEEPLLEPKIPTNRVKVNGRLTTNAADKLIVDNN